MMMTGPFRSGAMLLLLSAVLHVIAVVFGGFTPQVLSLLMAAVVFAILAFGLGRGWRWLAYIAFFVVSFGALWALANLWSTGPVPGWLFASILTVNVLAAAALFAALWRAPQPVQST